MGAIFCQIASKPGSHKMEPLFSFSAGAKITKNHKHAKGWVPHLRDSLQGCFVCIFLVPAWRRPRERMKHLVLFRDRTGKWSVDRWRNFSFGSVPPRKVDRHILTKVMAYEEMKKQKREYFEKIQRFGPWGKSNAWLSRTMSQSHWIIWAQTTQWSSHFLVNSSFIRWPIKLCLHVRWPNCVWVPCSP